jgi:uncharacterized cupredoxin-like copper-binding protein
VRHDAASKDRPDATSTARARRRAFGGVRLKARAASDARKATTVAQGYAVAGRQPDRGGKQMPRYRLTIAVLLAVTAATGCGGSDSGTSSSGSSSATTTATGTTAPPSSGTNKLSVTETEFKISPANPKIAKGGTVTVAIANKGQFTHALEVEGQGVEARSERIEPGETETLKVKLTKSGSYDWYCPIDGHRQKGMAGRLTVGS